MLPKVQWIYHHLNQHLPFFNCRALCDPNMLTFCKEGGTQLLEGLDFDQFSINNSKLMLSCKFLIPLLIQNKAIQPASFLYTKDMITVSTDYY